MLDFFTKDIGIDLGTANSLLYLKNQGIVINEPSVVSINKKTGIVLAIGQEAKGMLGKTPSYIEVVRPLVGGIVSNYEVTRQMLRYFINKVIRRRIPYFEKRVVIGVPSDTNDVDRSAVSDAVREAGAKRVFIISELLAAAIGADLPVVSSEGFFIVDIGGGTSEIGIISLGGLVSSRVLRIAGDSMNQDIISYIRDEFNLLIGEQTAEKAKIEIGSCLPLSRPLKMVIRGRDTIKGLPKEIQITDEDIRNALSHSVSKLVGSVKEVIEEAPPELLSDIIKNKIYLTGGGSLLKGLDKLLEKELKVAVKRVEDPLTTVVRGTGVIIEDMNLYKRVVEVY